MPLCLATKTFKPHNPEGRLAKKTTAFMNEIGIEKFSFNEVGFMAEPEQTFKMPDRELDSDEKQDISYLLSRGCIKSS